jgi:hypothetical protein
MGLSLKSAHSFCIAGCKEENEERQELRMRFLRYNEAVRHLLLLIDIFDLDWVIRLFAQALIVCWV